MILDCIKNFSVKFRSEDLKTIFSFQIDAWDELFCEGKLVGKIS